MENKVKKRRFYVFFLISIVASISLYSQDWLDLAKDRIDLHRKDSIKLTIVDSLGNPVSGKKVHVLMKKHTFKWGTNVRIDHVESLINQGYPIGSTHPYYNQFRHFNSVTPGNAGKWKGWMNEGRRQIYRQMRNWFESKGIANRGHTAVWESEKFNAIPDFLKNISDTSALRDTIENHIRSYVNALKDDVYKLDLVNELFHERHIVNGLLNASDAEAEHTRWYKWAKQEAPDLFLVANEFDIFQNDNYIPQYREKLNKMINEGAPIDGIGMQGHFFYIPEAEVLQQRLDSLKTLGLPMEVTEFDMKSNEYSSMERVLYVCFADTMITGFTMWGSWDKLQWRGNSAMYDEDWSLKPCGKAWLDLVKDAWWTDTVLTTSASGTINTRGFYGDYHAIIKNDSMYGIYPFTLPKGGIDLTINTDSIKHLKPEIVFNRSNSDTIVCMNDTASFGILFKGTNKLISAVKMFANDDIILIDSFPKQNEIKMQWVPADSADKMIYAMATDANGYQVVTDTIYLKVINTIAEFSIPFPKEDQFFFNTDTIHMAIDPLQMDTMNVSATKVYDKNLSEIYSFSGYTNSIEGINLEKGIHPLNIGFVVQNQCFMHTEMDVHVLSRNGTNVLRDITSADDHDVEQIDNRNYYGGDLDISDKLVGLWFGQIFLLPSLTIDSAFIQFTSESSGQTDFTQIKISGELNANPTEFGVFNLLSGRDYTTNSVSWEIPVWENIADQKNAQKTPDLKPILDEIIGLNDWTADSPVILITNTGTGKREAFAYDQNPEYAPELVVYVNGDVSALSGGMPVNVHIDEILNDSTVKIKWSNPYNNIAYGFNVYVNGKMVNPEAVNDNHYTISPLLSGSIDTAMVTALDYHGNESGKSKPIIIKGLGISQHGYKQNLLQIFPNPTAHLIKIQSPIQIEEIDIYNVTGNIVGSKHPKSNHIIFDVSALPKGVYLVKVKLNNQYYYRRLIIR